MSTNIKAVYLSATATAVDGPTRLRGFSWMNGSNARTEMVCRDASASGTALLTCTLPAGGSSDQYLTDIGIRFPNKLHITLATSCMGTFYVG